MVQNHIECNFNNLLFSGEARDILLRQSRLAQFYQLSVRKVTVLVIPTVLELFYQELATLATVLVIPTVLNFFFTKN